MYPADVGDDRSSAQLTAGRRWLIAASACISLALAGGIIWLAQRNATATAREVSARPSRTVIETPSTAAVDPRLMLSSSKSMVTLPSETADVPASVPSQPRVLLPSSKSIGPAYSVPAPVTAPEQQSRPTTLPGPAPFPDIMVFAPAITPPPRPVLLPSSKSSAPMAVAELLNSQPVAPPAAKPTPVQALPQRRAP